MSTRTHTVGWEELRDLLSPRTGTCLSLYQPTHKHFPDNQQDPIRFRNLLQEGEAALLRQMRGNEASEILAPLRSLAEDTEFWRHSGTGLAVLRSAGFLRIYKLPRPVPEVMVVSDSFHIKPLLRVTQATDRFHVLALSRELIRMFEGNRDALEELELPDAVPGTLEDALGAELTEPHQTVASYGGTHLGADMRHAHGSRKEETELDEERFFRIVDRAILKHYSNPTGLPLILAAPPQHQGKFRALSQNPRLVSEGIVRDVLTLTENELSAEAWRVMEPVYERRIREAVESYAEARAKGLGSDGPEAIAKAAAGSRVSRLLLEANRRIPGHLDAASGASVRAGSKTPGANDLLDDLAELVLRQGGEVLVIPAAQMPVKSGAAAEYRY